MKKKNIKNKKSPVLITTLPETGFLRLAQVLQFIPVCEATFWNGVKSGRFPKPFKNGRCTFWRVEDIKALIETIAKGGK